MTLQKTLLAICIAWLTANQAEAGLVITFGPATDINNVSDTVLGPFLPGATVVVPVLAHVTGVGVDPSALNGFNLAVDFGSDGDNLPSPFLSPVDAPDYSITAGAFPVNYGLQATPSSGDFDAVVFGITMNPAGVTIGNAANPTTLFSLAFKISASASSGIYTLTGFDEPGFTEFSHLDNSAYTGTITFDQGQFQVASAAVPEPGTIGFGLGVMALAYLRRRRAAAVPKDPAA